MILAYLGVTSMWPTTRRVHMHLSHHAGVNAHPAGEGATPHDTDEYEYECAISEYEYECAFSVLLS